MESLKELLAPKTINRISYAAIILWILFGIILSSIFLDMELNESRFDFRCAAESEKIDLVRGQCFEQYEKQYNKSGVPEYGFVILNFSLIGIVGVIYSQVVKSRVKKLLAANRGRPPERKRRLIFAYLCQLATRFAMGIVSIVLQTQVLYPANFPSDFLCQIARGSHAANASSTGSIQNTTIYQCNNQRATTKIFWMHFVTAVNGASVLGTLIEIIWILLRARQGNNFLEDSQFLADHFPPREEQDSQELEDHELQQVQFVAEHLPPRDEQDAQESEDHELQQVPSLPAFMESLKESVIVNTERPADLEAPFQKKHGEKTRNEDLAIDSIYTNLILITNTAEYDFSGDREEQLKVYPRPKGNSPPITREDIVDAEHKKVLIVGRPGIGKTLFCTKFLRDWACNRRLLNTELHFDLSFLLKFRRFNSVEKLSLRELLTRSEFSPPEYLNDEILSYILENPEKLLILFDGLDEFSDISSFGADQPVCSSSEQQILPSFTT